MSDVGDLHALGVELLAASVEALDTIPLSFPALAGAPGRSFVSPGRPAFDNCCGDAREVGGQLTVNAAFIVPKQLVPTSQGVDAKIGTRLNLVTFNITIARCIPVADGPLGEPPTVQEQDDASEQTDADAWALYNHLWNMVRAGVLLSICDEVFFDGLRALDPSGGCGGWVLTLRAQVDGYEESIST